ncbi:MAG TPA: hypothetical protein VME19_20815 [Streptosporangiaceae bacterium]|nr:hypothetical protein [Streptosporangiaceae bacterium]
MKRGDVQDPRPTLFGMDNMYATPAGAGPAGGSGPPGAPDPSAGRRKKRMLRWGAGITLAGFLAGGGIAFALSGSGTPAASGGTAGSGGSATSAAQSANAAVLNSALGTAASTTANVPLRRVRRALNRLRALGGVDGEFTFHNASGFHTLAFERGTITSVSGSDLVVSAPDGTSWTWLIVSSTVVRENGAKTTTNALADGETVFAGGPAVNGAKDARLIVIRAGASSGSSSVSGTSGTSVS